MSGFIDFSSPDQHTGFLYLASPYSHPDPAVRVSRYVRTCKAVGVLMLQHGLVVYSPISHSYVVALYNNLPHDYAFWSRVDEVMIDAAGAFGVLMLDGWNTSQGVRSELARAEAKELPILWFDAAGTPVADPRSSDAS
jgi:hypothetical protein